ncbi:MAG TPA: hypothetical protein DCX12_05135 [Chloroflexi bacterium]|jgi:hypothetical protein|nr:hypothetical protein [Chloroflexota bacterium]
MTAARLIASTMRRPRPLFSQTNSMRPTTKSQKQPFPRHPRQPLDLFSAISHLRASFRLAP